MNVSDLKVGDKVAEHFGYGSVPRISTIDGETNTCFRVGRSLYHKKNGSLRGGGAWSTNRITPVTPEIIRRVEYNAALKAVQAIQFAKLPTKALKEIKAIAELAREKGEE